MNLQQSKVILEKINALHKSMSMDEGNIASIERDLMLSYIKQLYEFFLHNDNNSPAPLDNPGHTQIKEKPAVKRTYTPPRIIEIPDNPRPVRQSNPEPVPDPMPDEPERPQPEPDPEPKPEPKPKPDPRPTPQPPQPQPQPTPPQPGPQPPSGGQSTNSDIHALFEFKAARELSEKLSERPISDLTKALAINDRLLYMNELFGKDLNTLNDTLGQLNRYDNMDEARGLLAQLAEQYDWTNDEKQPIAKDFIKLVKRRYQ